MALTKFKEIQNLTKDELNIRVRETERKIFESRMQQRMGQLENVSSIWALRKDLARTKTRLTQLEKESRQ